MKTLNCCDNATTMNDLSRHHISPNSKSYGQMMLTDIHDRDLLHLPDIHALGKRPEKSGDSRQISLVSKPSSSTNIHVDIKIHEDLADTTKTLDAHPDHDSHEKMSNSKCALPKHEVGKPDELVCKASVSLLSVPIGSPRLMPRRGNSSQQSTLQDLQASKGFSRSQTQLHKLGTDLLPEKFRPYRKSLSQREFSIEEKKTTLPDIVTNYTGKPVKISRSSSAVSVLPPISSNKTSQISRSQPDLLTPCKSPAIEHSCTFVLTRRLRIRDLWKRAFNKLRLLPQSDDSRVLEDESWTLAPGNVLRPVYSRWSQRRDALAEPERMCMPQVLREQIEKDVRSRKRSMKRKMSKFLNVNMGLNLEEDLAG